MVIIDDQPTEEKKIEKIYVLHHRIVFKILPYLIVNGYLFPKSVIWEALDRLGTSELIL